MTCRFVFHFFLFFKRLKLSEQIDDDWGSKNLQKNCSSSHRHIFFLVFLQSNEESFLCICIGIITTKSGKYRRLLRFVGYLPKCVIQF